MEKKEVKVCSNCLGNNIGKVFNEKAYFRSTKGHKPVGLDMCLDCGCYDTCSVKELLDKAREEGREELLDSIVVGIKQLKSIVEMFNPMSIEIRAKQSGEIEAYNGLLEQLSNLKTKEDGK